MEFRGFRTTATTAGYATRCQLLQRVLYSLIECGKFAARRDGIEATPIVFANISGDKSPACGVSLRSSLSVVLFVQHSEHLALLLDASACLV